MPSIQRSVEWPPYQILSLRGAIDNHQYEPSFRTDMSFVYGEPSEMAPGVLRVVANNPGPFTFKGTNTYIVGSGESVAVIDPGPDDPSHRDAVLAACGGRSISHILVTHTHRDHVDGLPAFAQATGANVCGYGRVNLEQDPRIKSLTGRTYIDVDFDPSHPLSDGDTVSGPGWDLLAIHTPGHAPDHLCFVLSGTGVVFSGDHVMGWNTTVVAPPEGHMGDYMASLERLASLKADVFLPGHGGRIFEPVRVSKAYLVHRRLREHAIMDAIRNGNETIEAIVALIYQKLDPSLITAAKMSVLAHIEHLRDRGLLTTSSATVEFSTKLTLVRS